MDSKARRSLTAGQHMQLGLAGGAAFIMALMLMSSSLTFAASVSPGANWRVLLWLVTGATVLIIHCAAYSIYEWASKVDDQYGVEFSFRYWVYSLAGIGLVFMHYSATPVHFIYM